MLYPAYEITSRKICGGYAVILSGDYWLAEIFTATVWLQRNKIRRGGFGGVCFTNVTGSQEPVQKLERTQPQL